MIPSKPVRASIVAALALAVGGCLSGPPPADHFYRLEVGEPKGAIAKPLEGTLHVDRLRGDAVLSERQMLYREGGNSAEIRQYTYHRWSDPPALFVQAELVEYLQKARVAAVVMPANARVDPDHLVSGRIRRFDQVKGSETSVIVELDLTLTTEGGDVVVHATYLERQTAANDSPAAAADAFTRALEAAFAHFVADIAAR